MPWLQLQHRLPEFVESDFLPEGWTSLKDPGGLGVNQCRVLLNHWWKRQQEGLIPFQFHQWEASPASYEADGITVKKPAQMVQSEPLPLPAMDPESDSVSEAKPKPKRIRKAKRKALPNRSSSTLPPTPPDGTSLPSKSHSQPNRPPSTSRSPSKSHRALKHRTPSGGPHNVSKEARSKGTGAPESKISREQRGRPWSKSPAETGVSSSDSEHLPENRDNSGKRSHVKIERLLKCPW